MIKKILLFLLVFRCSALYAQTLKTDVLVIGGGPCGVAAAVQCANSEVKTILAAEKISIGGRAEDMVSVSTGREITSGMWGKFREVIRYHYKTHPGYDTGRNSALKFDLNTGSQVLRKFTDTPKKLSVILNTSAVSIKKDGDYWEVRLSGNTAPVTVRARVVVDATENGEVAVKAGCKLPESRNVFTGANQPNRFRTSIAAGVMLAGQQRTVTSAEYPPFPCWYVPLKAVLLPGADNMLITEKLLSDGSDIQSLPMQIALGQGAGAVAAYCAFFKTTSKNLKVRVIQAELLDFGAYLLPFSDVQQTNGAWRPVQQVCATGMLKGRLLNERFIFMPDSAVETAEIKPVLTEIYARAFLWFDKEKPAAEFTLGNMLSLISDFTLTDPGVLKSSIKTAWSTTFHFNGDFDPNRPISRLQFAVLANRYLNPFARTVDINGRLIN